MQDNPESDFAVVVYTEGVKFLWKRTPECRLTTTTLVNFYTAMMSKDFTKRDDERLNLELQIAHKQRLIPFFVLSRNYEQLNEHEYCGMVSTRFMVS